MTRPVKQLAAGAGEVARGNWDARVEIDSSDEIGDLARAFIAYPLMTLGVVAAIHWEALRLWLKGARLVPRENVAGTKPGAKPILASSRHNDYTETALSTAGQDSRPRKSALVQ